MCAILDANVVGEAFGNRQSPAGKAFRERIDEGRLILVTGGKLADELACNSRFSSWSSVAAQYGKILSVNGKRVDAIAEKLRNSRTCNSDDEHVIALAQVSGARLLFTNDPDLQSDFKTKELVDNPRGKIYSTKESKDLTRAHRRMLADKSLCGGP